MMKKIYQKPLIAIWSINSEDILDKIVIASEEDDAAGAKKFDFEEPDDDWNETVWSDSDFE